MTTAQKLRKLREEKELSQEECAKLLGIDRTTYAKYENGGSIKRNVEKLASFFNVSTDYLLGRETITEYYHDPEVAELAEELRTNPGMKILFDASKNAKPEDLQYAADLLKRLKGDD